jgi:hypothetical protein
MQGTTLKTAEDERAERYEREKQRRIKLRFQFLPAVRRRTESNARLLERIAGETIQVDVPGGDAHESNPGCGDNKIRRATDAEAHRMGIWFAVFFRLDCRQADFLIQTAARLREHIAELTAIAEGIENAAKRKRKTTRTRRKAARVPA